MTQSHEGYNEYPYLNQVLICNIHWHRPPFFRLEGSPLRLWEGRPPLCALTFRIASIAYAFLVHNLIFWFYNSYCAGWTHFPICSEICSGLRNPLASYCQICYIDNRKGKARDTRPTLEWLKLNVFQHQPSLLGVVAAIFFPERLYNTIPQGLQWISLSEPGPDM